MKSIATLFTESVITLFERHHAVSSRQLRRIFEDHGYVVSDRELLTRFHQMQDDGLAYGIVVVGRLEFIITRVSDVLMDATT